MTRFVALFVLGVLAFPTSSTAQTGLGGLRGVIRRRAGRRAAGRDGDRHGARDARSADRRHQRDAANTASSTCRPGTFTITAELTGFATFRREGILIRTGWRTFQVDIVTMQLSALQETITVTGDSPMIEVDKASNVLNIDGEFQRLMPIQARRNYSDFLELTPGVISRGFDDGSGRQVYFGHATEHFAHVLQLEGTIATNYHDAQLTYVSMGADMVADTQVKTGGVDAASPMGTGLVMNVITKSGGNVFKGSGAFAYQPYRWNGNNVDNCSDAPGCKPGTGGTPTTAYVRQFDGALGGPMMRDKVWFFGALRRGAVVERHQPHRRPRSRASRPTSPAPSSSTTTRESWQPFLKVTEQGSATTTCRLLPARSPAAHRRPRVQLRADPGAVDRRAALQRQDHVGVGIERDDDLQRVVQRQGRLGRLDVREARAAPARRSSSTTTPTPSGGDAAGHRPHPRRRQPPVLQLPAGVADRRCAATSPTTRTAGSGTTSSRPASSPRRATPTTRTPHYVNDGFVLEEHRLRDVNNIAAGTDPVPPPLPDPGRPADAAGRGSRHRHLRAGLVAADAAAHPQPRRARRLRQAQRQAVRHRPRRTARRSARASASRTC